MSLHAPQTIDSQEELGTVAPAGTPPLGYVDWDSSTASNERVIMRSPLVNRDRIIRDQYVRIEDPLGSRTGFLGRIVAGPFFLPVAHPQASPMSRWARVCPANLLSWRRLSCKESWLAADR